MKKDNILIGAHVSTAGGFYKSIERGEAINANCIQIFTKSNRQWKAKTITTDNQVKFLKLQKKSTIKTVVAHAAYLINLGSKSDETIVKSIDALATELQRCQTLNIPYLVLHPGTARFESEKESCSFIAKNIDLALEKANSKDVTLLLENMAGQGSTVGHTFEQLGAIRSQVKNKKLVGICFDTCHAFAAGYSFDKKETYTNMWNEFEQHIGLQHLKAFHINDSKKEQGSKVDRHEHIGKGKIPIDAFKLLLEDENFSSIPKILETPKEGDDEFSSDIENIKTLKDLL